MSQPIGPEAGKQKAIIEGYQYIEGKYGLVVAIPAVARAMVEEVPFQTTILKYPDSSEFWLRGWQRPEGYRAVGQSVIPLGEDNKSLLVLKSSIRGLSQIWRIFLEDWRVFEKYPRILGTSLSYQNIVAREHLVRGYGDFEKMWRGGTFIEEK